MSHKSTSGKDAEVQGDPYVAEYPGVCGGYPVIRETRIPVRLVVQFSRDGATVAELAEMWPTVTVEQIRGALAYYARDPRRIDEDITRNAQAQLTSPGAPWPA